MAERRMFAKTIVLSDSFLDMPMSSRCLYFTLGMFADDDGFVNNPKSVMRQCGATVDDMNVLVSKKFLILMDGGVVVIKHWRIHNYIQKDRYVPTKYQELKEKLGIDENKAYSSDTECIQSGYIPYTQDRIDKSKDSIDKDSNKKIYIESIKHIVEFLNEKAGTKYKPTSKATASHIRARLTEGYTEDDFKAVIEKKCNEWLGTDMEQYLRPETLFGSKFEAYLNAPAKKKKESFDEMIDRICEENGIT